MNALEKHIVTGMVTDMNISRFDATKVSYARNVRISTVNDKNELLTVLNEKGPLRITGNISIPAGTVIGSALINEKLILFIKTNEYGDCIYRLTFPTDTTFNAVRLYSGTLGFDMQHPIETLSVYENENVQKVYWVDGIHQLRCINIVKDLYTSDSGHADNGIATLFDVNPVLTLNHNLDVTKRNSGGEFPAGTIQYAFTYFNMYNPETPVFEVSEQYLLSPQRKGAAADGRVTCSFNIHLSGLDTSFEYLRAYAIIRTSENATPAVRLLGDFRMSSGIVSFVDNGAIGSTVDASYLLFVGGEPVVPTTFTAKDQTLFLGNIKLLKPSIGNISITDGGTTTTLAEYAKTTIRNAVVNRIDPVPVGAEYDKWFYQYQPDNNLGSYTARHFKGGETYRLGLIAQHKTGVWSEVLWVGDFDNNYYPTGILEAQHGNYGEFWYTLSAAFRNVLVNNGFLRIAPVVVYPEGVDRKVFCQGIISATVFNIRDRYNNAPYAQSSWFFRPLREDFGVAAIPFASLYNQEHPYGEIQSLANPRFYLPFIDKEGHSSQDTPTYATKEQVLDLFGNDFMVDTNILTFNSPDIELDDSLQQEDFEGLKFRIVGTINSAVPNKILHNYEEVTAPGAAGGNTLDIEESRFYYDNNKYYSFGDVNFPGYNFGLSGVYFGDKPYLKIAVYPWHKSGNLIGDTSWFSTDSGGQGIHINIKEAHENKTLLQHKVLSQIWYGSVSYSTYAGASDISLAALKLYDGTQSSIIKLGDDSDAPVYYGEIDKVITHTEDTETNVESFTNSFSGTTRLLATRAAATRKFNIMFEHPNKRNRSSVAVYTTTGGSTPLPFDALDPVSIKYKSTRHAVIRLQSSAGHLKPLYRYDALQNSFPSTFKPYWDEEETLTLDSGYVNYAPGSIWTYWTGSRDSYKSKEANTPILYVGELYRDQSNNTARFGGSSSEDLLNNIWMRCGKAAFLSGDVTIKYTSGDTYFTRYDCLKTYPYADDDVNSVVEILSTTLETRVNLDARYDNTRALVDNTLLNPTNTNLVNRAGMEQKDNFFTFGTEDYSRENIDIFPNLVTVSREKVPGASVDVWGQINLTGGLDLDGTYGEINALKTFNNDVYAFQADAFGQILFNSRVQIPTSDGQPIEITNGMKLQGIRYLSNTIGCQNKWSICSSSRRLYWFDNRSKDVWGFGSQGLENLSTRLGVKSWFLNAPSYWHADGEGFNTFFDKRNSEVYFSLYSSGEASFDKGSLMFSENLDSFISVFDYTNIQYLYNLKPGTIVVRNTDGLWSLWKGEYNNFFSSYKPFYLRFIANMEPTRHKVFNTLQWRSDSWDGNSYVPNHTFNKFRVWNQYQDSGYTNLSLMNFNQSNLKKKFNTFRALVPRDSLGTWNGGRRFDRIRGNYVFVELKYDTADSKKIQFYDLEIGEFIQ